MLPGDEDDGADVIRAAFLFEGGRHISSRATNDVVQIVKKVMITRCTFHQLDPVPKRCEANPSGTEGTWQETP
eukprot:SAG11_NODE_339_length_10506_cov_12.368588_4_plen_73_part_00